MGGPSSGRACFTLVSGGYRASAGQLAVALGTGLVAELNDRDLDRSWAAAGGLSAQEAQAINQSAGLHLMGLLGEDLDPSDHAAAAIDAALVFLLAMKRYGVSDPRQIPACAVRWTPTGSLPRIHLAS